MNVNIKSGVPAPSVRVGRIATPYVVWVFLHWAALTGAEHTFPRTWFYGFGPGGSPPWYFIGQDAVDAVWSSAAAVLMLAFSFASIRRLGPGVWACLGVAVTSFLVKIGAGANVFVHTRHLWDSSRAFSEWTTFEAYLRSQQTSHSLSLCTGIVLAGACLWQYGRALKAAGGVH